MAKEMNRQQRRRRLHTKEVAYTGPLSEAKKFFGR